MGRIGFVAEVGMDGPHQSEAGLDGIHRWIDLGSSVDFEFLRSDAVPGIEQKFAGGQRAWIVGGEQRFGDGWPGHAAFRDRLGPASNEVAPGGDGQLGMDLFDAKEFDMIAEGVVPLEPAGRLRLDIDPAALEALLRQFARFQVELIVAQRTFVRVDVMGSMSNTIMSRIGIRDHSLILSRSSLSGKRVRLR